MSAKKLFIELGRDLEPLARSLEGVVIQRKDEHCLTYPFDPKNMAEDEDERGIWIRLPRYRGKGLNFLSPQTF